MEDLQKSLDEIQIDSSIGNIRSPINPPDSYKSNNKKEKTLIAYAENFQRQFKQLYGDRKLLFLIPPNEFGVQKFICTTVRPTQLPFKEMYDFDGCASFVADYLTYKCLFSAPNELPRKLHSPTSVLQDQTGNCFEYSVLLTSLLIGAGYDAYCVCGYATKEVTLMDQTRKTCPLLMEKEKAKEDSDGSPKSKYAAKLPKQLKSMFLINEEQKQKDRLKAEEEKKQQEEAARIAELEKPPPDKYYGLRFHCWVLVLSGRREIGQSFFIEPTTGETQSLDYDCYLGIEALWNHKNFWVNMQDCSEGIGDILYDLGDATRWEYFFPNVDKPRLLLPGEDTSQESIEEDDEDDEVVHEYFELPPSWVDPIVISKREYESRYPKGKKTTLYYKSKLESFAPYLNDDGLTSRLTQYKDMERSAAINVKTIYVNRKDRLLTRFTNIVNGQITETFGPGKHLSLKEHTHFGHKGYKTDTHSMLYYDNARVDGLTQRDNTLHTMIECYKGRNDRLIYKEIVYTKPTKKFEPADKDRVKHIQTITEKYDRNPLVPANEDIAQKVFSFDENKVILTYHLEENRVTRSQREFYLPNLTGEQAQPLTMNSDMTSSYQVDSHAQEPKQRVLFEQLEKLVNDQEASVKLVRQSEKEVEEILSMRHQEESNIVLTISVYDVERNETARIHRQEQEMLLKEEERIRREKEKDYLAPFLARLGDKPELTKEEKTRVREDCLQDLRTRLVEVANIIQSHFEKESDELKKKQSWYKRKQSSINKEEEAEYVSYCSETMFKLHMLEQRLNNHKVSAPQKYLNLERRLQNDERLK